MLSYAIKDIANEFFEDSNIADRMSILSIINDNLGAFLHAKKCLDFLNIYIIVKNAGGQVVFKTVNGSIVEDKLDIGYTNSRDCVLLEEWNVAIIYKVSFLSTDELGVEIITYQALSDVLLKTISPKVVNYVLLGDIDDVKSCIKLEKDLVQGLSYNCLLTSITVVFDDILKSKYLESQAFRSVIVDFN